MDYKPGPRPKAPPVLKRKPGRPKGSGVGSKKVASAPGYLSCEAKKEWRRVVPVLEDMGVMGGHADYAQLECYCESVAEFRDVVSQLKRLGPLTPQTMKLTDVLVKRRDNATVRIRRFGRIFGLSPADRDKMRITNRPEAEEQVSALQQFLRS